MEAAQKSASGVGTSYGDELPAGATLANGQYTIERYLNSGGFGITYLARDSLDRQVVIKECFPGAMCCRSDRTVRLRSRNQGQEFKTILSLFEKEARALSELSHPYIVGVHQIFKDNGTAYMALDFVPGKDLAQILEDEPERLDPEAIKQLLIKILEAIGYIHDRDILHRDISPDNILLDDEDNPVLIDFGAARDGATRVSRVLSKVLTVKDGYSPQEFYLAGSKQEYASDLYALAATFYHLVSRTPPPSSHLRLSAAARGADDPLQPLPKLPGYDEYFIEAINRCLSIFPADRLPSAEAWRDAIDFDRRRKLLLEQAAEDRELEERVTRTVEEYRQMLADDDARAAAERAATAERARAEAEAAKPAPRTRPRKKKAAAPQPTRVRQTLLLEDPLSAVASETAEDAAAPKPAPEPAPPPRTESASARGAGNGNSIVRFLTGTRHLIQGLNRARHE